MIEVMFFYSFILYLKILDNLTKLMSVKIIFRKCQNMPENAGLFRKMPVAWTLLINASIFPTLIINAT